MVDMGILSKMKSPSPKCYMTFWDIIIYSDTSIDWSDISLNRYLVIELDLITIFDVITSCPIWNLHLFLCWDHSVMSTDLLSFAYPSVLLFCLTNNDRRCVWQIIVQYNPPPKSANESISQNALVIFPSVGRPHTLILNRSILVHYNKQSLYTR